MEGVRLLTPTQLYNLLNANGLYPMLSDPNYLLLLDARSRASYDESHILTAKKAPTDESGRFMLPYDSELECKLNIVVYDSNTRNLKEETQAFDCAKLLWKFGSRFEVKVLEGGYEDFSALYPYLRTQDVIFMPRGNRRIETYPIEIIPSLLYLGNWRHGNTPYIQKDLKIKGHINCQLEPGSFFKEEGKNLLHIAIEDNIDSDIYSKFQPSCEFIEEKMSRDQAVLVFSHMGLSTSVTIVIAYLMRLYTWSLAEAYTYVQMCKPDIRPNRGFIRELSQWEEGILGEKETDISDPNF
ncbi:hypothetical protein NP493_165g04002 [Ridgeia piscesae]|uniref:Serine/threonine/tyrosine-interacting-like protein 1 n=1 Tax=Ridgeia piscesae TaxID=27915 RepID=A0AAD9UFI9_RIDPI|nr:hypothetical protein NP493_165g04002 [Ridgeia piscesae]